MYNINLALNRPTFMSSVHIVPALGGAFSASKAVDGNKDPIAMKPDNSCVHSWTENNPWWAVSSSKKPVLLLRSSLIDSGHVTT